jgi:hypothetical protein
MVAVSTIRHGGFEIRSGLPKRIVTVLPERRRSLDKEKYRRTRETRYPRQAGHSLESSFQTIG